MTFEEMMKMPIGSDVVLLIERKLSRNDALAVVQLVWIYAQREAKFDLLAEQVDKAKSYGDNVIPFRGRS